MLILVAIMLVGVGYACLTSQAIAGNTLVISKKEISAEEDAGSKAAEATFPKSDTGRKVQRIKDLTQNIRDLLASAKRHAEAAEAAWRDALTAETNEQAAAFVTTAQERVADARAAMEQVAQRTHDLRQAMNAVAEDSRLAEGESAKAATELEEAEAEKKPDVEKIKACIKKAAHRARWADLIAEGSDIEQVEGEVGQANFLATAEAALTGARGAAEAVRVRLGEAEANRAAKETAEAAARTAEKEREAKEEETRRALEAKEAAERDAKEAARLAKEEKEAREAVEAREREAKEETGRREAAALREEAERARAAVAAMQQENLRQEQERQRLAQAEDARRAAEQAALAAKQKNIDDQTVAQEALREAQGTLAEMQRAESERQKAEAERLAKEQEVADAKAERIRRQLSQINEVGEDDTVVMSRRDYIRARVLMDAEGHGNVARQWPVAPLYRVDRNRLALGWREAGTVDDLLALEEPAGGAKGGAHDNAGPRDGAEGDEPKTPQNGRKQPAEFQTPDRKAAGAAQDDEEAALLAALAAPSPVKETVTNGHKNGANSDLAKDSAGDE
jgi:hypothetical protein